MYTSTTFDKRFTAIDLDPYGGPNQFLDGAIQSIEDGGLLMVTATDMAVLAGNTPEACKFFFDEYDKNFLTDCFHFRHCQVRIGAVEVESLSRNSSSNIAAFHRRTRKSLRTLHQTSREPFN